MNDREKYLDRECRILSELRFCQYVSGRGSDRKDVCVCVCVSEK